MAATATIPPQQFGHFLVPLDGSRLAEAALPVATALAARTGARVTLLHVVERNAPATVHGERHLTGAGEAEAYLHGVASRFADAGVATAIHAHPSPAGDVAASVAAHAAEVAADLIVLCAHGRGGLREWLAGSIAQRVIRQSAAPVLLVRPTADGRAAPFAPQRVVVALDGAAEGEAALPAAAALARACGAALDLLAVVATLGTVGGDRAATARLMPVATSAALDLEGDQARDYLERLRGALAGSGLAVRAAVERGDPVQLLAAHATQAAVVALATHGRTGFDALWSGSVGAKVVARVGSPLLLVPAGAAVSGAAAAAVGAARQA